MRDGEKTNALAMHIALKFGKIVLFEGSLTVFPLEVEINVFNSILDVLVEMKKLLISK